MSFSWMARSSRKFHVAFSVLPVLEKELANMLIAVSDAPRQRRSAAYEITMLRQSVIAIRSQLASAIRHLSDIRLGLDRHGISDESIAKGIASALEHYPDAEKVANRISAAGGPRAYYRRISFALIKRHASFSRSLRILRRLEGDRAELDAAIQELVDDAPGGSPDLVYTWLCGGGPAAWAVTIVIAAGVFLLDDDQTDDPEAPEEDEEDQGDESEDGGVCYPDDELDQLNGTCEQAPA